MYDAPWILPVDVSDVESTTSTQVDPWDSRKRKGDYHENPVFGAVDEEPEESDSEESEESDDWENSVSVYVMSNITYVLQQIVLLQPSPRKVD